MTTDFVGVYIVKDLDLFACGTVLCAADVSVLQNQCEVNLVQTLEFLVYKLLSTHNPLSNLTAKLHMTVTFTVNCTSATVPAACHRLENVSAL